MAEQPLVGQGLIFEASRSHSFRRTTLSRTPLDPWSARRRDLYLTTHSNRKRQTSMLPGGIRTHNPSKRVAADPRLRSRGHWDRQHVSLTLPYVQHQNKAVCQKIPRNKAVIFCCKWVCYVCLRSYVATWKRKTSVLIIFIQYQLCSADYCSTRPPPFCRHISARVKTELRGSSVCQRWG